MHKKWISLLLALFLALGLPCGVLAETDTAAIAVELKSLGLFLGVSDTDFDLERTPTRVEAVVMLVRLLGKETAAAETGYSHPFTDVPEWADTYIGYAYQNGLARGVAADTFGDGDATTAMYLTFVLRALGYTEGTDGDFLWDDPYALAADVGIADTTLAVDGLTRGDIVKIYWKSLHTEKKDSDKTLSDALIADGAITEKDLTHAETVLQDVPFTKVAWDKKLRRFMAVMEEEGTETLPPVDEHEPIPVPTDPTLTDK